MLWDFDGVIIDSNLIREDGFKEVLKDYPFDQVSKLINFHKANGGLSRYVKFRYFFENIRNEELPDKKLSSLLLSFGSIMEEKLNSNDLLISETIEFIKKYYKTVEMHIVSGSDQVELRGLCKSFGIDKYFKTINGSPIPKNNLVKEIIEKVFDKVDICLIGDSTNDLEAASKNGITFFAYNNLELINSNYIHSFKNYL